MECSRAASFLSELLRPVQRRVRRRCIQPAGDETEDGIGGIPGPQKRGTRGTQLLWFLLKVYFCFFFGEGERDRRTFIGIAGLGATQGFGLPRIAKALGKGSVGASSGEAANHSKAYGSGHFGDRKSTRL